MPFTLSHVVAVIPVHQKWKNTLLLAPLAIGSMLPDIPYFINQRIQHDHTWAAMFPTYVPLGYFITLLWYVLLRRPFYAFYPYLFDQENPVTRPSAVTAYLLRLICIGVALIIGVATHLIWDGFTHDDHRTFMLNNTLAETITIGHWGMPLHRILQYVSSFVGLLLLLIYCVVQYRARQVKPVPVNVLPKSLRMMVGLLCIAAGVYLGIDNYIELSPFYLHTDKYFLFGQVLVGMIQGSVAGFMVYALIWQCSQILRVD